MAVTVIHLSRREARQVAAHVPLPLAGLALIAPSLDLINLLQSLPRLEPLAAGTSAATFLGLVWLAAVQSRPSWMVAAIFAFGTGTLLRFAGAEFAPLLALLGILSLGIGGAFSGPAAEDFMADDESVQLGELSDPLGVPVSSRRAA